MNRTQFGCNSLFRVKTSQLLKESVPSNTEVQNQKVQIEQ
ncbi:unnamed protein product (macronuclear) [Paramecium tetraurelia]|uniref:Uncharacterized protein n=1 Tax=Paramecium tetraurelia TaxID=5888 RepID=A0DMN1_PARTE|nr:uncharacterized protein GSPATT00039680001 [Paramecium tetraurelia]CAK84298.1 unnamed protein product [Paramecium tetraurelia]